MHAQHSCGWAGLGFVTGLNFTATPSAVRLAHSFKSGGQLSPSRNRAHNHIRRAHMSTQAKAGDPIEDWIEQNLGAGKVVGTNFMGSSSWSSAYTYTTEAGQKLFVKTSQGRDESMFMGEALGLKAMYETNTLRIPQVFHYGPMPTPPGGRGLESNGSFIVMEHLNFGGRCDQAELGRLLALMHKAEPADENALQGKFGFAVDNTIGGTPQPNAWMDNWVDFFRERRLKHQLQLAGDTKLSRMGKVLCDNLEAFFEGIEVKPAVLHGDLWSGNISAVDGVPAIFDPAVYYGHHEAEFGMSWCASFTDAFYRAYHEILPRAAGFEDRKQIYLLYHYLNHYNLFGSGYYHQCESILTRLTKKLP